MDSLRRRELAESAMVAAGWLATAILLWVAAGFTPVTLSVLGGLAALALLDAWRRGLRGRNEQLARTRLEISVPVVRIRRRG
jgi:hypothetical protein